MAPKLAGIHRRPAAHARMRDLLDRPFNLQPALAGEPVQVPGFPYWLVRRERPRREGRVRWIWFDVKAKKVAARTDRQGWKKELSLAQVQASP